MQLTKNKTTVIVMCGIFVALGTVLSVIPLPFSLPFGGSVTIFSMVPVVLLSQMFGTRVGLLAGTVYGLLQAVLGAAMSQAFAGVTGWSLPAMFLLDYVIAFAVLGFGGIFMKRIKNPVLASGLGAFVATFLRYVVHFISGFILWGSYAEWFFSDEFAGNGQLILDKFSGLSLSALYSLIYNGLYMVPEIIITVVGCCAVAAVPAVSRLFLRPAGDK